MSRHAEDWAWSQTELSDADRLLLLALAGQATDKGYVFKLSQKDLAELMGKSDRAVRGRLKALEEKGLIRRKPVWDAGEQGRRIDVIILEMPKGEVREPSGKHSGSESGNPGVTGSLGSSPPNVVVSPLGSSFSGSTPEVVAVPNVSIDKLKLSPEEWRWAGEIMGAFNSGFGTKFTLIGSRGRPTEHLKKIVCRIRANPEVTLPEHLTMIAQQVENPWFGKTKPSTVGVLYGERSFPRCMTSNERPNGGRNFEDERPTATDEDHPW